MLTYEYSWDMMLDPTCEIEPNSNHQLDENDNLVASKLVQAIVYTACMAATEAFNADQVEPAHWWIAEYKRSHTTVLMVLKYQAVKKNTIVTFDLRNSPWHDALAEIIGPHENLANAH